MERFTKVENWYQEFSELFHTTPRELQLEIDIQLLSELNLFNCTVVDEKKRSLERIFTIIETKDKMTLINEEFIIWIVPVSEENVHYTKTMIALNKPHHPQLEVTLLARGVYNDSRFIIHVLDSILNEIHENETVLQEIEKAI